MHLYRISGLVVGVEMEWPGAIPWPAPQLTEPDILVRLCPVPEHLNAPTRRGPTWELDAKSFLLTLPGIGRFLAEDGRVLHMDPAPGTDPADALPFLTGTCFGALLHQRGAMVLHASTVEMDGRAIAICGPSGAGKSSLAAALCAAGGRFIGDDIAAIGRDDNGHPTVWPDGRLLKLAEDSIARCGLEEQRHGAVRSGIGKFYVAPAKPGTDTPLPLGAIYVLRDAPPSRAEGIERLGAIDSAQALLEQSHRPRLSLAMAQARSSRQVELTAAIIRHVPVFHLIRRRDLDLLAHTADMLRSHWRDFSG